MRRAKQMFLWGVAGMILPLQTELHLLAQQKSGPRRTKATAVSVPFVGCKSDGQTGPLEEPKGSPVSVQLDAKAAKELAYYDAGLGVGVLGPRGWYCFGEYGSSGATLFVSPQPIGVTNVFPAGFTGPVIEVSHREGQGFGALEVAEVIARVFPEFKAFANNVVQSFGAPISFGPYPEDRLVYRSKREVEYETPSQTEGLGTHVSLKKNDSPIEGVAILVGPTPNLVLLSVRLPPSLSGLTSAIIRQVERDSASLNQ
jgi:hypothetical protein